MIMDARELLHRFLDNDLSDSQEELLRGYLAQDEGLRNEMKTIAALRTAIEAHDAYFTPAPELSARVFSTLGFSAPTLPAPVPAEENAPARKVGLQKWVRLLIYTSIVLVTSFLATIFFEESFFKVPSSSQGNAVAFRKHQRSRDIVSTINKEYLYHVASVFRTQRSAPRTTKLKASILEQHIATAVPLLYSEEQAAQQEVPSAIILNNVSYLPPKCLCLGTRRDEDSHLLSIKLNNAYVQKPDFLRSSDTVLQFPRSLFCRDSNTVSFLPTVLPIQKESSTLPHVHQHIDGKIEKDCTFCGCLPLPK